MKDNKTFISSTHYHLWTDALHSRALAYQAKNSWDQGTYVRWTIVTAWSVMEIVCQDAIGNEKIGYNFKEDLDESLYQRGFEKINWGEGIWQKVLKLRSIRKNYVHVSIPQKELFPPPETADWAISIVREATKFIYNLCNKPEPIWILENIDCGWDSGKASIAHMTGIEAGAENNPEAIKIAYVRNGKEFVSNICLPGADYETLINDLLKRINTPISLVRAYKGQELIVEILLNMRGA